MPFRTLTTPLPFAWAPQMEAQAVSIDPPQMPRMAETVQINRNTLRLTVSGELPQLESGPTKAGHVSFAPVSIKYLAVQNAGNSTCC